MQATVPPISAITESCERSWATASRRRSASNAPMKCSMSTHTDGIGTPSRAAWRSSGSRSRNAKSPLAAQLDPVVAGARGEVPLRLEALAGEQLLLAGDLDHENFNTTWSASCGRWSSMANASAASSTAMTCETRPTASTRALLGEAQERLVEAGLVPAPGELRRHAPDLGGDDPDPVVVELVAEPQPGAVALVEAGRHDPAVDRDRADRVVQGRIVSADLDRHVGAAPVGQPRAGRARRRSRRRRRRVPRRIPWPSPAGPAACRPRPRRRRRAGPAGWRAARARPGRRSRPLRRGGRRRPARR